MAAVPIRARSRAAGKALGRAGAVGLAAILVFLTSGCGVVDARDRPVPARTGYGGDLRSTLRLKDGRQLEVRLVAGQGILERHRPSTSARWGEWRTLHRTSTDPCQGVGLTAVRGTVALIAGFGACSGGEAPTESVAAVGTGDLTEWQRKVAEGIDGWEKSKFTETGARITFDGLGGTGTLVWRFGEGFSDVGHPDRPEDEEDGVDEYFLGTWETRDGRHRVTIEEPAEDAARVVFETVRGKTCKSTAQGIPAGTHGVNLDKVEVTDGARHASCPHPPLSYSFERGEGGTLLLDGLEFAAVRSYVRAEQ